MDTGRGGDVRDESYIFDLYDFSLLRGSLMSTVGACRLGGGVRGVRPLFEVAVGVITVILSELAVIDDGL